MDTEDQKAFKAKQLRYKKPVARDLNLVRIQDELRDMIAACEDIHWYDNDQESLVNALDGDEDEAYEFKMAFSDLEADLEQFQEDINSAYVPDCFDLFFPAAKARFAGGYLGYDQYEGDYYGLEPYEYSFAEEAAAKRLTALTKKELLEAAGACMKIFSQYTALRYRYDCMEAAIEILRGENMERIKVAKGTEEQYQLERMLHQAPQEYWIQ